MRRGGGIIEMHNITPLKTGRTPYKCIFLDIKSETFHLLAYDTFSISIYPLNIDKNVHQKDYRNLHVMFILGSGDTEPPIVSDVLEPEPVSQPLAQYKVIPDYCYSFLLNRGPAGLGCTLVLVA